MVNKNETKWSFCKHEIIFPRRPLVMAIINVNDDSFSRDGTLDSNEALQMADKALVDGADIIDFGAESARTNREAITIEEETKRLEPVLKGFQNLINEIKPKPFDQEQVWPPVLSVNTWRPEVAEFALKNGAELLNDIGALNSDENAKLCAEYETSLLIMHSRGVPKVPHLEGYEDVLSSMESFFEEKLELATKCGLNEESIILDPGIDFAKNKEENLLVYKNLERFHRFGRPILLPTSRKTVIGEVLGIDDPVDRDAGTIACSVAGVLRGAQIYRVHNVKELMNSIKVVWGIFQ